MTWSTWSIFMITETTLCLTPGPAVLFVVAQALRWGGRRSLWATLGILGANASYCVLSALGLGALLLASPAVFRIIRYAGAAYLVFIGISMIFGPGIAVRRPGESVAGDASGSPLLGRAFLVQVANPKALLFFTAILPQFIRPERNVPLQFLILGVSSLVVEFLVLGSYGFLAGRASGPASDQGFAKIVNRVAGMLLVIAALGLALAGRG